MAVVLKFEYAAESPGGLVRTQISGPHPKMCNVAILRICISNKFPGDTDIPDQETTLRKSLSQILLTNNLGITWQLHTGK